MASNGQNRLTKVSESFFFKPSQNASIEGGVKGNKSERLNEHMEWREYTQVSHFNYPKSILSTYHISSNLLGNEE